jgi:hypothetical protein
MSCNENILSLIPPSGKNGISSYTYVAYADDVTLGTPDVVTTFNNSTPLTTSEWFAIITSSTPITPIESNFQGHWAKFKGNDGVGSAGIDILNNGDPVSTGTTTLNFIGGGETGVTAQDAGSGQTDITIVTAGLIRILKNDALSLISLDNLIPGATYHLYDIGSGGVILKAITNNQFASEGYYIDYLPDYQNTSGDFQFPWIDTLSGIISLVQGGLYSYGGLMYENLTGLDNPSLSPNNDSVNWSLVNINDPRYIREIDSIVYDIYANEIIKRSDKRGNVVNGKDAIDAFLWGNDLVTGNTVNFTVIPMLTNYVTLFQNNFFSGYSIAFESGNQISARNCIITADNLTVYGFADTVGMYGWFISFSTVVSLSASPNAIDGLIITREFSTLTAQISGIVGTTLTIPDYARNASTLVINDNGSIIDTINGYNFNQRIKIIAYQNTNVTIQPTAKASALTGQILADDLTALTLINVNTPIIGNPSAIDFCEITNATNSVFFDNWNIVNSKIYV